MAESLAQPSQPRVQSLFPGEIHNNIVRLLGPVDLISLSQTDRYFRQLISPGKKELAERLLVIECLEEHGGGTSLFFTTPEDHTHVHETLGPWEANRWACPGCLKLLPHHRFDNKSLLCLETRKPAPGTPAADIASSWVPTQHRESPAQEARRTGRQVYDYYTRDCSGHESDPVTENERCGFHRHLRRCIECQHQLGVIGGSNLPRMGPLLQTNPNRPSRGWAKVSARTSRGVLLSSGFVRFWPKLDEMLESKAPSITPLRPKSMPWRREKKLWEMYMIRCGGCEEWKELRAFRIEGSRLDWLPVRINNGIPQWFPRDRATEGSRARLENRPLGDLRCHHCFAREHGALALGEILAIRFKMNIQPHMSELEYRLHSHYNAVKYLAAEGEAEKHRPAEDPSGDYDELVRLVRQGEEINTELSENLQWRLNQAHVDRLRNEAKEFKALWIRMRKSHPSLASKLGRDKNFVSWVNDFKNSEVEWKWLKDCESKVLANPTLLLKYALNQDVPGSY
ncbi:unnamed protein product [Clonostachys solani]|uniref:F-box domain-containing protein n=1 Tax=Clonostachys solani TaxID=160281 RepID=A0A9N9YYF5_9HYPO|nr:unnamed protein product [Clonostachys solani]